MNVVGSRPDGWWRDRGRAMRALVERLDGLEEEAPVVVVFDGRPREEVAAAAPPGVEVRFSGGRRSADEAIVELVSSVADRPVRVVTSDHGLGERVRGLGADVEPAGAFLRRLEAG